MARDPYASPYDRPSVGVVGADGAHVEVGASHWVLARAYEEVGFVGWAVEALVTLGGWLLKAASFIAARISEVIAALEAAKLALEQVPMLSQAAGIVGLLPGGSDAKKFIADGWAALQAVNETTGVGLQTLQSANQTLTDMAANLGGYKLDLKAALRTIDLETTTQEIGDALKGAVESGDVKRFAELAQAEWSKNAAKGSVGDGVLSVAASYQKQLLGLSKTVPGVERWSTAELVREPKVPNSVPAMAIVLQELTSQVQWLKRLENCEFEGAERYRTKLRIPARGWDWNETSKGDRARMLEEQGRPADPHAGYLRRLPWDGKGDARDILVCALDGDARRERDSTRVFLQASFKAISEWLAGDRESLPTWAGEALARNGINPLINVLGEAPVSVSDRVTVEGERMSATEAAKKYRARLYTDPDALGRIIDTLKGRMSRKQKELDDYRPKGAVEDALTPFLQTLLTGGLEKEWLPRLKKGEVRQFAQAVMKSREGKALSKKAELEKLTSGKLPDGWRSLWPHERVTGDVRKREIARAWRALFATRESTLATIFFAKESIRSDIWTRLATLGKSRTWRGMWRATVDQKLYPALREAGATKNGFKLIARILDAIEGKRAKAAGEGLAAKLSQYAHLWLKLNAPRLDVGTGRRRGTVAKRGQTKTVVTWEKGEPVQVEGPKGQLAFVKEKQASLAKRNEVARGLRIGKRVRGTFRYQDADGPGIVTPEGLYLRGAWANGN